MYQVRSASVNPNSKPVAKKIGQVVVGFGLLFAAALAFQNCSGYQMYDSTTVEDLASTCGSECNLSLAGVALKLTNTKIIVQEAQLVSES